MNILLMLIPISLLLLGAAIWAFVWAVRGGQFDDLDTPALDILHDEKPFAASSGFGEVDPRVSDRRAVDSNDLPAASRADRTSNAD